MASKIDSTKQDLTLIENPPEKEQGNGSLSVAQEVIASLAQQLDQRYVVTSSPSTTIKNVLELTPPPTPCAKKRRPRKKKGANPMAIQPSLFAHAKMIRLIPHETSILDDHQELLLQEILQKWSLSANITLTDLLGIEIFDLLTKTCTEARTHNDLVIEAAFQELLTIYEAEYAIIFISLMAQRDCKDFPDQTKYLDNQFLLPYPITCERHQKKFKEQVTTVNEAINARETAIKISHCARPKILSLKALHISSYRKALTTFNEKTQLFLSLLKSPYYLELLLDNNIFKMFGDKALQIKDPYEGLQHLKYLTQFQRQFFITAQKKGFIGIGIEDFYNPPNFFPDVITVKSLKKLCSDAIRFMKTTAQKELEVNQEFQLAKDDKLTHLQYCLKYHIDPLQEKTQDQLTSDLYAKTMIVSLICNFWQDIYISVDTYLLPLVSPDHKSNHYICNRMAFNSDIFFSLPDILQINIDADDFKKETLFSDSVSQMPIARNMHFVGAIFVKDLQCCLRPSIEAFSPFSPFFKALLDKTKEKQEYLPIKWSYFFDEIQPVVEEHFSTTLMRIKSLHEHYFQTIQSELKTLPSLEEKTLFVQEFREFLFKSSLPLCQLVMFYADLQRLMGYYDVEQLDSEDYLLPRELTDFLELKRLNELLEIEESIELASAPSSISTEDEACAPDLSPPSSPPKKKGPTQKKSSLKKPLPTKKSPPPTAAPITHAETLFKIERGEKALDILKRIKKELGLTPDRIKGGHFVFSGGATLPMHGGTDTLAPGTARSLERQLTQQLLSNKV